MIYLKKKTGKGGGGEGRGVWEKSESNNYIPFGDVVKN
jgi:hypothetical protein